MHIKEITIFVIIEQAAKVLSNELERMIKYVQVPLERVHQATEDMTHMCEWYDMV